MRRVKGLEGEPHWSHCTKWTSDLARSGAKPDNFCHHDCKVYTIYPITDPCPLCPQCGCKYTACGGTWII